MPRNSRKPAIDAAKALLWELDQQLATVKDLGGIETFIIEDHEKTLKEIRSDLESKTITDEKLRQTLERLGRMADRIVHLWIARDPKLVR